MRTNLFISLLLLCTCAHGTVLLYEDFQDGRSDGWQAFGEGDKRIVLSNGNGTLRLTAPSTVARQVALQGATRIEIGASLAADDLTGDGSCVAEASLDDGRSWFAVNALMGPEAAGDAMVGHTVAAAVPDSAMRVWIRARVAAEGGRCWLDNVYVLGAGLPDPAIRTRKLSRAMLRGDVPLSAPVDLQEYARTATAETAKHRFSGSLQFRGAESASGSRVLHDAWDRVAAVGPAIRRIPDFTLQFVQHGDDLIPLQRGPQRSEHPYWEVVMQPGKVWYEEGDGDWSRASVSLSLRERAADCIHNGVMTWLYNDREVSRVAYQISSETCAYFKIDLWGVGDADYLPQTLAEEAAQPIARLESHRSHRMPVKDLAALAVDHPGSLPLSLGIADGIHPADITVRGMVVDGTHYRSACTTRHGPHPYCASLPLPSYSTAKSIFAALALMRMEKLYPGLSQQSVGDLVGECSAREWRNVRLEDALDMATGNYKSVEPSKDEDSLAHRRFIFWDKHRRKIVFACSHFPPRAEPGKQFVYHTSDTYLLGTALQSALRGIRGEEADIYEDVVLQDLWQPLELSPLLDQTLRSYDEAAQPFAGYGLGYEVDDIVRIGSWLQGLAEEEGGLLDIALLNGALQRNGTDPGLVAGSDLLRYNNGFWAFNAAPSLNCREDVWTPFMSGVSGITVALFPNNTLYYYFSDSYVFRWQSGRNAAHTIRTMCP